MPLISIGFAILLWLVLGMSGEHSFFFPSFQKLFDTALTMF
ncbi:hypothetical protein SAMN05421780_11335 [Flexibacter flexilis DSM 6793]|uniref:Uncharacterized protein n=1 Tax=Flexibacter flexilis DSM 6793 TaxID=927664 RepID=A0A1I1NG93_9BACT|nr:hypothetical protein SAMN05421780_11335 [Flexibacter flexilis DSM 6793]